jgi:hypothetical protein
VAANDHLTVVGVFPDRPTAEAAIMELREAGFSDSAIGFAMRDMAAPAGIEPVTDDNAGERAGEGAATGLVTGGVVGGIAAAAASLLIPGVGPVIGGGILASVLGGAAVGAAAGGLLGALVGMGVPEDRARRYQSEFEAGRAIVTVEADDRYKEATDILSRHGTYDGEDERDRSYASHPMSTAIAETAALEGSTAARSVASTTPRGGPAVTAATTEPPPAAPATSTPAGETPIPAGASVVAGDRPAGTRGKGEVSRTEAATGSGTADADTNREMPAGIAGGWPTRADDPYAGKYVEHEEQVRGAAAPSIPGQMQDAAPGTVPDGSGRSEDAARGDGPYIDPDEDLERVGATSGMAPTAGGAWSDVAAGYRQRWQSGAATSGERWEDAEPAYRYAHEMAADPRYAGRAWQDVEANLGASYGDWTAGNGYQQGRTAWERVRDHVHDAWDRTRGS